MERGASFMKDNLSGYNLPADSLAELRSILTRRFSERFSVGLSTEGRAAMKEASELIADKETEQNHAKDGVNADKVEKVKQKGKGVHTNKHKPANTTESLNKNTRARSNLETTGAVKSYKQQGKQEVASVKYEVSKTTTQEESNELVKAVIVASADNVEPDSVEKCLDWMEDQETKSDTHKSTTTANGACEEVNESSSTI